MRLLPNGMYEITNKQTGETRQVPPAQLNAYGLAPQPAQQAPVQQASQPTQPQQPQQQTPMTGSPQFSDGSDPFAKEKDLRQKMAFDINRDAQNTGGKKKDVIQAYYNALIPTDQEKAVAQKTIDAQSKKDEAKNLTKSTVQNLLDTYQSLPGDQKGGPIRGALSDVNPYTQGHEYESQRKAMGAALKDLAGAGAGSGVRVTQAELNAWSNLIPSVHKTEDQNKQDLVLLDKQLKGKFGEGLDQDYLDKFGVGKPTKDLTQQVGEAAKPILDNPVVHALTGTAQNIFQDNAQGAAQNNNPQTRQSQEKALAGATALEDHAAQVQDPQEKMRLLKVAQSIRQTISGDTGAQSAAYSPDINTNVAQRSLGGAAEIAGAADVLAHPIDTVKGAYNMVRHPIETVKAGAEMVKHPLDTLKADVAGSGYKGTGFNLPFNSSAVKSGSKIVDTATTLNGGGSTEYAARQAVNPNAMPQQEVLLEAGVTGKGTDVGKVQQAAVYRNNIGSKIGDIYKNSDRHFTGDKLGEALDQGLKDTGYDQKSIDFIKGYMRQQGDFNMSSSDDIITAKDAWKAAQKLESSPPKMMDNPESAKAFKDLSKDAARIVRQQLVDKHPELQPLNARYSAISDWMDNQPAVTKGADIGDKKGIIRNIPGIIKDQGVNRGLQFAYDKTGPQTVYRDMRFKQGNVQFKK